MPVRLSTRELEALYAKRPDAPNWRREGAALVLVLPWPPSVNHLYARRRGGGVRIADAGRAFKANVYAALAPDLPAAPEGRLCVEIDAQPPDDSLRDIDNLIKCTLDALKGAKTYRDDSLIDRVTITRRQRCGGGRLVVRITAWEE